MSKKTIATALAVLALSLYIPNTIAATSGKVHKEASVQTADPSASERACLVAAAWNEARGRPDKEISAVMHVVVNRTKHPAFQNTVCGVVLEKGQFSMSPKMRSAVIESKRRGQFVMRGLKPTDAALVEKMEAVATIILDGNSVDPTKGATHFFCPKLRKALGYSKAPAWAMKLPMTLALGEFRFFRLN